MAVSKSRRADGGGTRSKLSHFFVNGQGKNDQTQGGRIVPSYLLATYQAPVAFLEVLYVEPERRVVLPQLVHNGRPLVSLRVLLPAEVLFQLTDLRLSRRKFILIGGLKYFQKE